MSDPVTPRPALSDLGGDVATNGISKLVSRRGRGQRDRIRERATEVKADQRKRGRYLGGIVPFGWRVGDDGHLVPMLLALVDLRTVILLTLGAAADTGRWLDSPDGQCCQPFFSRLRICRGYGGRRITGWSLWLFKGRAGFGYALCCLG